MVHNRPTRTNFPSQPTGLLSGSNDPALRIISSSEIFQGAREVLIQHDEKVYRLQVTRNGKLILVK